MNWIGNAGSVSRMDILCSAPLLSVVDVLINNGLKIAYIFLLFLEIVMKRGQFTGSYGFTLVEIMIVVSIIGLLAALGIPVFSTARINSHAAVCRSNRRVTAEALEMYCMENAVELTPANFPNLCAARDALAPGGSEEYVKDWKIFECSVADAQDQHDYSYIWENGVLVGLQCNNSNPDVRNLHNLN